MLRVTVELVPFGSEELAKTIAEVCIANVSSTDNIANYEASGYEAKSGKISELAAKIENYDRADGAVKLVGEIFLAAGEVELSELKLGEELIAKTRLMAGERSNDE
jgi:hypothetical protein